MPRILFVTDQWGYGTMTSAMAVANLLNGSGSRWLVGEGAGFMLATPDFFEACVSANTMAHRPPQALKDAVRHSDLVVSVMNLSGARVATELQVPCVYVDTLLWMWHRPPRLPPSVVRYFAAEFPGVEDKAVRWQRSLPPTEIVAPLIAPYSSSDPRGRTDVLVNFGGLSSPLVAERSLVGYAQAMVQCVTEALADWRGRITVSIGDHVLRPAHEARPIRPRPDVRFLSLSHTEYLKHLEGSRLLVSSPGLSATHEAFSRGVPCLLLPSQNLSQALTLQVMDRAGASFAMDWDTIYGLSGLTAQNERRSCLRIADCIDRFRNDSAARASLVRHLKAQLGPDRLDRIAAAQAAFVERHRGHQGPRQVAAYVRDLLRLAPPDSQPRSG